MNKNKHPNGYQVIKKLPEELSRQCHDMLARGYSGVEISNWLKKMGHSISHSTVCRYKQKWSAATDAVNQAREMAKTMIKEIADRPNIDLNEAVDQMFMSLISNGMASILDEGVDFTERDENGNRKVDLIKLGNMFARMQSSAMSRERVKSDFRRELEAKKAKALTEVEKLGKRRGLSPDVIREFENVLLGL